MVARNPPGALTSPCKATDWESHVTHFAKSALMVLAAALLAVAALAPAAPAAASEIIKIGVLQDPKSLNLWLATDSWSQKVLKLVYQPLYLREPSSAKLVPWLAAEEPDFDPETLTCIVKLRPAKWSDGSDFTAQDVVFTREIIHSFQMPRHYSKWKFIESVEAVDAHTVRFKLKKPKAIFLTRTLTTPIVQKKQWEPIVRELEGEAKALNQLMQRELKDPVGTGPFTVEKWSKGAFLFMKKNPHFFGQGLTIAGHKLGPHVKGIIFKVYGTADAAILALRKGDIDYYWNDIQSGYLQEIKDNPDIKLFTNKKSALYYLGFNLRRPPMSDAAFRRATAFLVAKEFIIKRILQGYGEVLHSLIPPGNEVYYNPEVPTYGHGMSRDERVVAAYQLLRQAGYTWETPPVDDAGQVQPGKGLKGPDGRPLGELTILTPPADYDPHRAMAGQMIQEWLRQVGIQAISRPMAFGALIEKVKERHDFDMFVLGYGSLSLDPGYLRAFFHSKGDKPRGWNMSGYQNPEFDKLATASDEMLDPAARQEAIHRMQQMLVEDVPYLPLYNPLLVEGVRIDQFTGWVEALGGVGNIWSLCEIRPK
jgi:ABC-type transport system substrate-binding protein